jgi:hypothetical protein
MVIVQGDLGLLSKWLRDVLCHYIYSSGGLFFSNILEANLSCVFGLSFLNYKKKKKKKKLGRNVYVHCL